MHNFYYVTSEHMDEIESCNFIGHWLQKVLWDMKGKINGTLDDAKLFLYSAVS